MVCEVVFNIINKIINKLEFNSLLFASALTGWILYHFYPNNMWVFGGAILCTSYCIIRLAVYVYTSINVKKQEARILQYENEQNSKKEIEKRNKAQFVFDSQDSEGQQLLIDIVRIGEKSSFTDAYIINNKFEHYPMISQLKVLLCTDFNLGQWVRIINENQNKICVSIITPLNLILEDKIKK